MSEFSMSNTKKAGLPSFDVLSDLFNVFFFVLSHPLYFSYFIFFSPYLLKLFSFLSPLFITTTLLVLAFLSTVSPGLVQDHGDSHSHDDSPEAKLGFLAITYRTVLERLRSKEGDDEGEEFQRFEEFEVFKIVFDTSSALEIREDPLEVLEEVVKETCSEASEAVAEPVDKCLIVRESDEFDLSSSKDGRNCHADRTPDGISMAKIKQSMVEMESLKWCLEEEKKELEIMSCKKEDTKVKPWIVESDKVDQAQKEELFAISGSKAMVGNKTKEATKGDTYFASPEWDFDDKYSIKSSSSMDDSPTHGSNLGSFGSMRKEKEWRRTLACKLFEERHNADGSEGMDSLWETYETESNKAQGKNKMTKNNTKKGKKGLLDYSDDDEEYEDETDGQLCCLQALKFSAGKMNLGMGRPNLVKISKALKGIGWLHNVTRHGKKRYN